jgi:WD40 repeat protein/serine/threonine protein kinase
MTPTPEHVRDLFLAAVRRPAAQWDGYLSEACAGDDDLRRAARELLDAHVAAGSFLESSAPDLDTTRQSRPQALAEAPGDFIGPYRLMEQIGEGGFGLVFVAEQQHPVRRRVALKVIKPGMDSRQVVARFEAERQALAMMDHPNIAKVFDGGATESGRPFFVMELVKGVSINQFCDENRLNPRDRLKLFADLCAAVQHAHQKGIIHRDLKPSNVLVSSHDGTPVVKVIDFGVAKAVGQSLTDKTVYTGLAQMVGTPLYMSPEQAGSSGLDVDTRTDIYALGVLLYELLTGTTPFDRERLRNLGYDEIRRIIREEEPARPSNRISTLGQAAATISAQRQTEPAKLTKLVRGELDWIVMKCLEKDRNRRYGTAAGLVADVRSFLCDEPVQACPPSAWYRFRKLARRNRRALATLSVLTLAAIVGVGALAVSTFLVWKANKDLTESVVRERLAADRERHEAYFQRITVAHRELSIDNLAAALRALHDCPEDLREWEWYYLMRLCKVDPLVIPVKTEANGVAFSRPGGERLASAGGDGTIAIWNSRTGAVIQTFQAHTASVVSVAFHPDGKHLASRGADLNLKVWDLTATGQAVFTERCDLTRKFGSSYTVAFSPDGRLLAAGSGGTVRVWDWKTRQVLHTFAGHEKSAISVAFSRDGRWLASASTGEGVNLWDIQTEGSPLRTFLAPPHPVSALAFSPDGGRLAEASLNRKVRLWDTATRELRHTLSHDGTVQGVAFSPDGSRLASVGEEKIVRVWDATTGRELLGLRGHTGGCGCVAFSPDGLRLASASKDKTIRVWDATPLREDERQETFTFTGHGDEIRTVAVSPDGRIASAGNGTPVKVWNPATGEVDVEFNAHAVTVFCLAWHPDGERIACASWDGRVHTVEVFDTRTGKPLFPLSSGLTCFAMSFSPDGRYLVTGAGNGALQVWDAGTGKEVGTLGTHDQDIRGVVFSPIGGHLASASGDGIVKLWDATNLGDATRPDRKKDARHTLTARVPGPSLNVAFSPDGERLATGGEKSLVNIWDVKTGMGLQTLPGHNGFVYTVAFSHDGRWIASGSEDSTVKIWDGRSGELVRNFRGHTGIVASVAFSPDGRRLVSGSRDHTVKVWDVSKLGEEPNR